MSDGTGDNGPRETEGHVDHDDDSTKQTPPAAGRPEINRPAENVAVAQKRPSASIRLGGGPKLVDVLPSDDESDALLDSLFADVTEPPAAVAVRPGAPRPVLPPPAPTPLAGGASAFELPRPAGPPRQGAPKSRPIPREDPEPPSADDPPPRAPATITIPAPALSAAVASEHEFSVPRDDDDFAEPRTALLDADMARILTEATRSPDLDSGLEGDLDPPLSEDPASDRTPPSRTSSAVTLPPLPGSSVPFPSPPSAVTPAPISPLEPSSVPLAAAPAPTEVLREESPVLALPEPAVDSEIFDLDEQGEAATEIWEGADDLPGSEPDASVAPSFATLGAAPRSATETPAPASTSTPEPALAPLPLEDSSSGEASEALVSPAPELDVAPSLEIDLPPESPPPPPASAPEPAPSPVVEVEARVFGAALAAVAAPSPPALRAVPDSLASAKGVGSTREGWLSRVTWLRAEAGAIEDATARSRILLVASELAALAGEEPLALELAGEARDLTPSSPLAQRQVRGLYQRDGEWNAAVEVLDVEARLAPTPEARAHASLVAAEILRQKLDDREGSGKRLDAAARALPGDPRPVVQRFCDAIADADLQGEGAVGAALARVRVPDAPGLAPLAGAFAEVALLRATPVELASKTGWARPRDGASTAYERLLRARAALGAGDVSAAVGWVESLAKARGLGGGAGWLAGVLAAPRPETRERSLASLRAVVAGSHGPLAARAVAARAIELGDAEATRAALDQAPASAFSAADRIAIGALGGATREELDAFVDDTVRDAQLAPLVVAATSALSAPSDPGRVMLSLGSARASTAVRLGRALAAGPAIGSPSDEVNDRAHRGRAAAAVRAYGAAAPDTGVARALALELEVEAGAVGEVARALSSWGDVNVAGPAHHAERDRALAGALVAELGGNPDRAASDYERACALDAGHEGAVRARASFQSREEAASALVELADSVGGGARAALLLVEAAIRLADANPDVDVDVDTEIPPAGEAERLFRSAAEIDLRLPFAAHFGERLARARGDRERVLEWLRLRRETSEDAGEQALDLVREALLLADEAGSSAASLLEQALPARPSDVGLRELYERLSADPPPDRAEWRVQRAAEAVGPDAARLALEAALELERSGDMARAAVLARQAVAAGDTALAPILAYRAALAGHGASELVDELLPKARALATAEERLEVYERLADLDEVGRDDPASGLLWRRTILEEVPDHLPTLRRVASALAAAGREGEIEPIALAIAKALDGPEATAHAIVSARLRLRALGWEEMREPLEVAYKHEPRALWVLRQVAAHARAHGDARLASVADEEISTRVDRPLEGATLLLRAAQAARQAGELPRANALLGRAVELAPQHVLVQLERAEVLVELGDHAAAAEAFEASADVSAAPEESVREIYRAAVLWGDVVKDAGRARAALERVTSLRPAYEDAFERLRTLYLAEGARAELATLLERRLDSVTDPSERVELEVLRGRTLAEVGDVGTAKRALARALEESPDHVDALEAFAGLCSAEGDWTGAEQALIRLARLVPEPARQAAVYLRLGELYDDHLPNPERAELAYQEILKRAPADLAARERLVALYQRTGDTRAALEQQTALVNEAEAPEAKCQRTVDLARIHEASGDSKKAESTLLSARKTWPKDDAALLGLAQFYQRTGQTAPGHLLLDRAVADARRALSTGRFEPYLFGTLATVATLRNRPDAANIAHSIVAALDGTDSVPPEGAGLGAGEPSLDDLLAPDVLTPAFRDLLRSTGPLLDAAVPYDLGSIRAVPLPLAHAELGERVREIAAAYGIFAVHVQVSGVLGAVCLAASAHPPTLVLGQALVTSTRADVRDFLVHRAMKVLQANAAVLSRTAPIDLWPLVAAYLRTLVPTFAPQGVDAAKLGDWQSKLTKALPGSIDPQLATLASDVIGTIGNRASTLNTVVNGWGDRAALLAVGDPNLALVGIASAGGHANAPPASGKERVTWIGRNTEARELVVFAVSDAYAEARARLGLGS